jgi:thioredoxin
MKTVENNTDYKDLLEQDKPILLDFYADWCGPCQTLIPTVEKLSKEYKDTIEIQKVNVDQNSELAKQFEVRSIPALFFIKNTQIVDRLNGTIPENILREKLEALLN